MILNSSSDDIIDSEIVDNEFLQNLRWFEDEFDIVFNKTNGYTEQDITLANQLLNELSKLIDQYRNEKYLYLLTYTLSNIEKKHPEFF